MSKEFLTFYGLAPDGKRIEGVWRGWANDGKVPGAKNPNRGILARTSEEIQLLKNPDKVIFEQGKLIPKRQMFIKTDKTVIKADGVDSTDIWFENIPDSNDILTVQIAGENHRIHPDDVITLTADASQVITIELKEAYIWANPLTIMVESVV